MPFKIYYTFRSDLLSAFWVGGGASLFCFALSYTLCLNSCCQYGLTDSDTQKEEPTVRLMPSSPVVKVPLSTGALCPVWLGEAAASHFFWLLSCTALMKL